MVQDITSNNSQRIIYVMISAGGGGGSMQAVRFFNYFELLRGLQLQLTGSFEVTCITITVSLFFLAEGNYRK